METPVFVIARGTRAAQSWLVVAVLGLTWLPLRAPAAQQYRPPPFDLTNPAIVEAGRIVFNRRCAGRCHGVDGQEGFDGPILVGKPYLTPPWAFAILVAGRSGTAMPSWTGRLSDDEFWQVIAFMSALGEQARSTSTP